MKLVYWLLAVVLLLPLALAVKAADFDFFFHVQQVTTADRDHEHIVSCRTDARTTASSRVGGVVASVQWPGSFCDARSDRCCFPGNQKQAADFSIHGLWPNYASCRRRGSLLTPEAPTRCRPDFCNPKDPLNTSLVFPSI